MMKKFISVVLVLCLCLCMGACGVTLDEAEKIDGNGTDTVVKGGVTYTNDAEKICADGTVLYTIGDLTDSRLFALGEYLYVNTGGGAMQLALDGSKMKKFGSGEIIAAKGRWIYYQSADNKVGNMIMYKIDMIEGRYLNVFQDTIVEIKEIEEDVFYFKGLSGNEYINPLNDDNGYFYQDWLNEDVTEATE